MGRTQTEHSFMKRMSLGAVASAALVLGFTTGVDVRGTANDSSPLEFTAHTIDTGLTGGYQVVVADLNRDGKPDVLTLASGLKEIRWYENPGWKKHVLIDGLNRPINMAAYDVDGDGIPEVALAQEFATV